MDAEEKFRISSVMEACDADAKVATIDGDVNAKESCNSFKTSNENDSMTESGTSNSNQSSATSLDKSTYLSRLLAKSKEVSDDERFLSHDDTEVGTEEKTSTSQLTDVSDGKESDTSIVIESEPDEEEKGTDEMEPNRSNTPEVDRLGDSAGSGESTTPPTQNKSQLNVPVEVEGNVVESDCPDPPLSVEKVIGDTFSQGHHADGVKPDGEGMDRSVSPQPERECPDIETPIASLVTILKPKAQNADGDAVATSETLVDVENKKASFFMASVVSGRIDLCAENAELIDDLIYWRNPRKTALIFISVLGVLLSMQFYSLISVLAYLSLAVLACGFVGRLYCSSHGVSGVENPILLLTPAFGEENVRKFTDMTLYYVNDIILAMRRLYMVDDLGDSLKFALVLWYLTYVGLWFNGMTIVTISFVTIFTLPNVYEYNKDAIDDKMAVCWEQWLTLTDMARTVSQESLKRILSSERHREKMH